MPVCCLIKQGANEIGNPALRYTTTPIDSNAKRAIVTNLFFLDCSRVDLWACTVLVFDECLCFSMTLSVYDLSDFKSLGFSTDDCAFISQRLYHFFCEFVKLTNIVSIYQFVFLGKIVKLIYLNLLL